MSFILDALRKSENERQRNQQPGIAPARGPVERRGTGIWLPLVALLVGVNLSLVLVMWLMSDGDQPQAPASPAPASRELSRELPAQPPAVQPQTAPAQAASETDPQQSFTPPAPVQALNTDDTNLPTMEELILGNAISMTPVQMDIHVYSEEPAERFVFINMTRYNEGQTLNEGPALVAITPSGIILRHQGYDFLVTREQ